MHILMISEYFPALDKLIFSGGLESRNYYTAKYLSQTHAVSIICRRRNHEQKIEKQGNLSIYRLGFVSRSPVASVFSVIPRQLFLLQAIAKGLSLNIDLVEGTNFVTYIPAFCIGKWKNIPKIAWYPDVLIGKWFQYFGFLLGIYGELGERLFLNLKWDRIITISEAAQQRLINQKVEKKSIRMIPCGVENKLRKNSGIKKKKQLIVVSRLVNYKRVDWAIRAFHELEKELPDYNLLIIGRGSEEAFLKNLIEELKLEKKAQVQSQLPYQSVLMHIQESELLLHPSVIEGFGIVLVEAAALGTPFVAADIPTSKELQSKLQSGSLFLKENLKDFCHQVKKLAQDHKLRIQLAQQGVENSRAFEWQQIAGKTLDVYQEL